MRRRDSKPRRTRNPDQTLDAVLWKPPAVLIRQALISPFFTQQPLPHYITNNNLHYFCSALQELSQLVHEVAVNTPIRGYRVNHILRQYLIFHIDHLVEICFLDKPFISSLYVKDPNDEEAHRLHHFIRETLPEFASQWKVACSADPLVIDGDIIKEYWISVKNTADAISAKVIAVSDMESRFCLKQPWMRLFDIYTTEGHLSSPLVFIWLIWGLLVAFFLDVMFWVMWKKPALWIAVVNTVVCTTGFGGFLILFYTLSRRREVAVSFAVQLSTNLSKEYYVDSVEKCTYRSQKEKDLFFFIQPRENAPLRTLCIKSSLINRQVVLIGITNVHSLQICSWNLCARVVTEISWEQAIGKSLDAVMDSRSVTLVRNLFNEIKRNPRQQKRLLLNSISKGSVAIKATATIAHVDGIPVGMIVGTVLEEEERAMISYLSRVGISALERKLGDLKVDDPMVHKLALANSWDALKERTTQAVRSWRLSKIEELSEPLLDPHLEMKVSMHFDPQLPPQFQCDVIFIQLMLRKLLRLIRSPSVENTAHFSFDNCQNPSESCEMLQITVTVEAPSYFCLDSSSEMEEMVSGVGHMYTMTSCELKILVPISASLLARTTDNPGATEARKVPLVCTFVIYEPDPVYLAHVRNFCANYQHRYFEVNTVNALTNMLDSLREDVSAVILSPAVEDTFELMVRECLKRNVFVVATRQRTKNSDYFNSAYDGPPPEVVDINYILHKPITEDSWTQFLDHLREVRKRQRVLQLPGCQECKLIRLVGSTNHSRVDLVRDILTGGVMARKTVYITAERPLTSLTTEVEIMSLLRAHWGVLRYIGSYTPSPHEFCMFLQYCRGGSLGNYARRQPNRCLTISQLRPYASQLLYAIEYIHGNGVAHRDIKPDNILLQDEQHLKVGDFGSATQQPQLAGLVTGGTLHFIAPERLIEMNTMEFGAAVDNMEKLFAEDIWSVGLTMLELLGAYPAALNDLTELNAFMQVYIGLRNTGEELEFALPVGADGDSKETAALAYDFIRGMLQMDPKKRPSAAKLVKHPFVDGVTWDIAEFDVFDTAPGTSHLSLDPPRRRDEFVGKGDNSYSFTAASLGEGDSDYDGFEM